MASHCEVSADDIRSLAREVAAAPSAAVYGRIGTSTVEFGTLGSWLVDVVNILTGNLDAAAARCSRSHQEPTLIDDQVIAMTLAKEVGEPHSPVAGRSVDELTAMLPPGQGLERRLDMMPQLGACGDAFGAEPDALTLAKLKAAPHGIDLGRCGRGSPRCCAPSGRTELGPHQVTADLARLRDALGRRPDGFVPADRTPAPAIRRQLDA